MIDDEMRGKWLKDNLTSREQGWSCTQYRGGKLISQSFTPYSRIWAIEIDDLSIETIDQLVEHKLWEETIDGKFHLLNQYVTSEIKRWKNQLSIYD